MSRMSESKLEQLARLSQTNWVNWNAEEGDAVWGALPGLLRCVEAARAAMDEPLGVLVSDDPDDQEEIARNHGSELAALSAALSALEEGAE